MQQFFFGRNYTWMNLFLSNLLVAYIVGLWRC